MFQWRTKALFSTVDAAPLGLMRIAVGVISFIYCLDLANHLHLFLGQDFQFYYFGAFLSICFAAGLFSKSAGILLFLILTYGSHLHPFLLDSDDGLLRVEIFLLLLTPCQKAYSIDSFLKKEIPNCQSWHYLIFIAQLMVIYTCSGISKLQDSEWISGEAILHTLQNPAYVWWNLKSLFPHYSLRVFLTVLTYLILFWEILFSVLILSARLRRFIIAFGIGFHICSALLFNLRAFPFLMLVLYVPFFIVFSSKQNSTV